MIAGGLASVLAAAWKFLRPIDAQAKQEALDALYVLGPRIREARQVSEPDAIEHEIDRVLERSRVSAGDNRERNVAAVNVAAHRLENLIHDRRTHLASQQDASFGS